MKERIEEKNCKECLHFEACCKWTDFPKQLGFPVCRKYRKQNEGEWIWKSNGYMNALHCSLCNKTAELHHNFCPGCGAKMKGERG